VHTARGKPVTARIAFNARNVYDIDHDTRCLTKRFHGADILLDGRENALPVHANDEAVLFLGDFEKIGASKPGPMIPAELTAPWRVLNIDIALEI
jgi:hypothetical protein